MPAVILLLTVEKRLEKLTKMMFLRILIYLSDLTGLTVEKRLITKQYKKLQQLGDTEFLFQHFQELLLKLFRI